MPLILRDLFSDARMGRGIRRLLEEGQPTSSTQLEKRAQNKICEIFYFACDDASHICLGAQRLQVKGPLRCPSPQWLVRPRETSSVLSGLLRRCFLGLTPLPSSRISRTKWRPYVTSNLECFMSRRPRWMCGLGFRGLCGPTLPQYSESVNTVRCHGDEAQGTPHVSPEGER